jgi:hypothetical protein
MYKSIVDCSTGIILSSSSKIYSMKQMSLFFPVVITEITTYQSEVH